MSSHRCRRMNWKWMQTKLSIFNNKFTFHSHISAVCSSRFYHMQDLWRIRHYLDLNSANLPANTLVSSRVNCCNSLLSGIADANLTNFNMFRIDWPILTKSPPCTPNVPRLCSLQWLSVKFRVDFNICLLTYMTLQKNNLFVFIPVLLHHSHPGHWDQTKESPWWSMGSRPPKETFHSCTPSL